MAKLKSTKNIFDEDLSNAVEYGDLEDIEDCLKMGADADIYSNDEYSLLSSALLKNNEDIINLLIKYKVNVNTIDNNGNNSLTFISDKENINIKIIEKIIKKGINLEHKNKNGKNALIIASINDNHKLVELLIKYGADKNLALNYIKNIKF